MVTGLPDPELIHHSKKGAREHVGGRVGDVEHAREKGGCMM